MEWACTPGILPSLHVLGSHQTHGQLGMVVHDCSPSYLEAEAGVQGMQCYRVKPCPQTNKTTPGFPSQVGHLFFPSTHQGSKPTVAVWLALCCSAWVTATTGFSHHPYLIQGVEVATEVAGYRAVLSICCCCFAKDDTFNQNWVKIG